MDKDKALQELRSAAIARDEADTAITHAVSVAKAAGASWADIAAPLGIGRQRAHQKYSGLSNEVIPFDDRLVFGEDLDADDAEAANAPAALTATDAQTPETPSIFSDTPAPAICEKHGYAHKFTSCADAATPIPMHAPNGDPIYLPSIGDTPAARAAAANECPPLYVPTLAECQEALDDAKETMRGLVTPGRWDFDNMKCSHAEHRTATK